MTRTWFHTLPVKEETRERIRGMKGTDSYDAFLVGILDRIEMLNNPDHHIDLRREK